LWRDKEQLRLLATVSNLYPAIWFLALVNAYL